MQCEWCYNRRFVRVFTGLHRAYSAYVEFFEKQIAMSGVGQVLEQYVFSPAANDNEVYMLLRFVAGVYVSIRILNLENWPADVVAIG